MPATCGTSMTVRGIRSLRGRGDHYVPLHCVRVACISISPSINVDHAYIFPLLSMLLCVSLFRSLPFLSLRLSLSLPIYFSYLFILCVFCVHAHDSTVPREFIDGPLFRDAVRPYPSSNGSTIMSSANVIRISRQSGSRQRQ